MTDGSDSGEAPSFGKKVIDLQTTSLTKIWHACVGKGMFPVKAREFNQFINALDGRIYATGSGSIFGILIPNFGPDRVHFPHKLFRVHYPHGSTSAFSSIVLKQKIGNYLEEMGYLDPSKTTVLLKD